MSKLFDDLIGPNFLFMDVSRLLSFLHAVMIIALQYHYRGIVEQQGNGDNVRV